MGANPSVQIQKQLYNLKFAVKSMQRESQKCTKLEKQNKIKCKKAMEKGLIDNARIYAENSIRQKNQALNFLKLSSRMDAVTARLQTAVQMNKLNKQMINIVKSMGIMLNSSSFNIEKLTNIMDKFETQFDDLDITSKVMESAIDSSTAQTMPQNDVQSLMNEIADENGLEFESEINNIGIGVGKNKNQEKEKNIDELEERLKRLQSI